MFDLYLTIVDKIDRVDERLQIITQARVRT